MPHLKPVLFVVLLSLTWSVASAQSEANATRLSNAMDSAGVEPYLTRRAAEAARDAGVELSHLHEGDTKDVVQYWASKARTDMEGVDSTMKHVVDVAGWTDWWAGQAGCEDGSGHAQEATETLTAARATFKEAYEELGQATGDEDADALIGYLTTAYHDLIDGITKLTESQEKLNDAVLAIRGCQ